MKKSIFITGLFFFVSSLISCNKNNLTDNLSSQITTQQKNANINKSDVPVVVLDRFNQLYSSTNVKGWDLVDGNYLASFTFNGNSMSVLFAATGFVIETTTEILESQLPKSCTDYCAKYYVGREIKFAYKTIDALGRVFYKVEIDKTLLLFDAQGSFVRIIV